jgi:hypothetical protein
MKAWICVLAALVAATANGNEITISAGPADRVNTVLVFAWPAGLDADGSWAVEDGTASRPVQRLPDGRGAVFINELKANQSVTYPLKLAPAPRAAGMRTVREGNNVVLSAVKAEILGYNGDKTPLPNGFEPAYARGGYIFPVVTPSGKLVCDDYPPNHKHHHGIWFPWTKTEFEGRHPDFWNMGGKTGTVEFVELTRTFEGPVAAGLWAKHRFVDLSAKPEPKTALNETWDVVAWNAGAGERPYFVFDLVSTQTCASDSPLILPKYYYGGLGFRGNRAWDGKDNCFFLTSEGKTRADGNETTGRWLHVGGKVDGEWAGIAILGHPENFRAPQPLRLHPTEPFACFAPSQAGDWKIEPGKPYVSRYRFVVADGKPDAELIERLWKDYANPVEVTIK